MSMKGLLLIFALMVGLGVMVALTMVTALPALASHNDTCHGLYWLTPT